MATYNYNGKTITAPDDMPLDEVYQVLNRSASETPVSPNGAATSNEGGAVNPAPSPRKDIDPETLKDDAAFQKNAAIHFRMQNGNKLPLPDAAGLRDYALNDMAWFNNNLPKMSIDAMRIKGALPEEKQAFLGLLDTYENVNSSWRGAWNVTKAMAADPLTYLGASSFAGLFAKKGAQIATVSTFKQMLRTGVMTGIDGAVQGAASDAVKQTAEVNAGGKAEVSGASVATSGAIGGVLGAGLGAGVAGAVGFFKGNDIVGRFFRRETSRDIGREGSPMVPEHQLPLTAEEALAKQNVPATGEAARVAEGMVDGVPTKVSPETPRLPNEAPNVSPEIPKDETFPALANHKTKDGRDFTVHWDDEKSQFTAVDPKGKVIGELDDAFAPGGSTLGKDEKAFTAWVHVEPDWQRQGVAEALYERLNNRHNGNIRPSGITSEDAFSFWARTYPEKLDAYIKENSASLDVEKSPVLSAFVNGERPPPRSVRAAEPTLSEPPKASEILKVEPQVTYNGAPPVKTGNAILDAVARVAQDSGLRQMVHGTAELSAAARGAVDEILKVKPQDITKAMEEVRRAPQTGEQIQLLKAAVMDANEHLIRKGVELRDAVNNSVDPIEKLKLRDALKQVDELKDRLTLTDQAFGSASGLDLGSRSKGIINTQPNWANTPVEILKKQGIDIEKATPSQIEGAREEAHKVYKAYLDIADNSSIVQKFDARIAELDAAGMHTEKWAVVADRQAHRDVLTEAQAVYDGLTMKQSSFGSSLIKKTTEYVISVVFSPSTLIINTVPSVAKTFYRPVLDMISRGGDASAQRQMTATYSAMAASTGTAFKAARAAFEYERNFISRDGNKYFDGQGPAIEGMKGRVLRFFPRLVNATDEFFSQIHYRGYIAGNAAGEAIEQGTKNGLKGNALDDFVKNTVKERVDLSFNHDPNASSVIDFMRGEGAKRGLSGAELDSYVVKHFERDKALFKEALDEGGRNVTDDLLFRRKFSGEGLSKVPQQYEKLVNEMPLLRLFGQLFFRTPVRVFEEGFRLTPGLNLITPHFLSDLRGGRGEAQQVRAQGEALLAYGIAGTVFSLYAQGRITGSGGDFKQRRGLEDTEKYDTYSFKFKDGSTFGFRNLDPFSTPMKIIVNVLDAYSDLAKRQAQGEDMSGHMQRLEATLGAATGGIAMAIKDANLTTGASEVYDLFDIFSDPEGNADKAQKYLGKKLTMFVPSLAKKVIAFNEPQMNDPKTAWEALNASIHPSDESIPKQYTAMGRERVNTNPLAALTAFNYEGAGEKGKGVDPKELYIQSRLAWITEQTGKNFIAPYKVDLPGFDKVDLREKMTADGKTTLYTRWMQEFRKAGYVEHTYTLLKALESAAPVGTAVDPGPQTKAITEQLAAFRKAAFTTMVNREVNLGNVIGTAVQDKVRNQMNMGVPSTHNPN